MFRKVVWDNSNPQRLLTKQKMAQQAVKGRLDNVHLSKLYVIDLLREEKTENDPRMNFFF